MMDDLKPCGKYRGHDAGLEARLREEVQTGLEWMVRASKAEAERDRLLQELKAVTFAYADREIRRENERLRAELTKANKFNEAYSKRHVAQAAENERLRAALAEYADEANWGTLGEWLDANDGPWATARRALGSSDE